MLRRLTLSVGRNVAQGKKVALVANCARCGGGCASHLPSLSSSANNGVGLSIVGRGLATTTPRSDLMEFFDNKKNWGEPTIRVGRSWKIDELRLKSNTDLHKLWYILLKEKNMLLTMEKACKDQAEFFPNPERIDKVEESMKNLEEAVRERNRAYYLLETGVTGERPGAEEENFLGLPEYKQFNEYDVPKEQNKEFLKAKSEEPVVSPAEKRFFLTQYEDKQRRQKKWERLQARKEVKKILEKFPDADREAIREKYPDIFVERVFAEVDEKHLGNERPRYYFWNRCYEPSFRHSRRK